MKQEGYHSRRTFFKRAGIGTAAITALPVLASSCIAGGEIRNDVEEYFSKGDVVLFQGDSITDAGRDKKSELPNNGRSIGSGYAALIASRLLGGLPGKELTIYNRGISGNKVYQLADRWEKDCLGLKPNVLSILIGVNDYWHFRNGKYDGTPEIYENDFRSLLSRTRTELPGIKLIICEPFVLPETKSVDDSWLEPFRSFQEAAARVALEFDALWVPFQQVFNKATELAPATYWTADGVHPSMAGSELMAEAWMKALG